MEYQSADDIVKRLTKRPTGRTIMSMSKGDITRERILDTAFRMASRQGLEGLSFGDLAGQLHCSKSGLFAHFPTKEDLQVQTLSAAARRFTESVLLPAFTKPRGLPRLRQVFENWMRWATDPGLPGGCIFVGAAAELDDREGRARDYLVGVQRQLLDTLAQSVRLAVEEGHFHGAVDCEQFAFEMQSILLGFNHLRRLLRDPKAERRARAAFERLIRTAEAP
jgi:AcrR family transcriptional regulator